MRRLILTICLPVILLAAACGDDGSGTLAGAPGGGGDFCDFIRGFDEQSNEIDPFNAPEDLEQVFRDIDDALDEAVGRAPGEIRGDVETVADAMNQLIEVLEDYDFDFSAAAFAAEDDPRLAALDDPEVEAAGDRVTEFCGIESDGDPAPFDGDTGVPPDTELPDVEIPDFSDVDLEDPDAIAVEIYKSFGHDQETAECLARELGDFSEVGDDFDLSTTFCGLTMPQIVTGG